MAMTKPDISKCFPCEESFTNQLRCRLIRHIFSDDFLNTRITRRTGYFRMNNHKLNDPVGSHIFENKDNIDWLNAAEAPVFAGVEVRTFTSTTSNAPRKLIHVKASVLDPWGNVVTYCPDEVLSVGLTVCWSSESQGPLKNLKWMRQAMPIGLGYKYIKALVREVTRHFFDGYGEWVEEPKKEIEDSVTGFVKALDWEEDVEKTTFWRI